MSSAWVSIVGAVCAVLGLLVVSPQAAAAAIAWPVLFVLELLAKRWPGIRRVRKAGGSAALVGVGALEAGGRGEKTWNPDASVEERIAHLRESVVLLGKLHDDLAARVREVRREARREKGELREELLARIAGIEADIRRSAHEAREIQTAGFPLAALGALLAAVPFLFDESLPWAIAIVLASLLGLRASWRLIFGEVPRAIGDAFTDRGFFIRTEQT